MKKFILLGFIAAALTLSTQSIKAQHAPAKVWEKTFGGSNHDSPNYMSKTADGGYILGGWSRSGISGDKSQACRGSFDYWVVKLDANYNKQWDKTFGGNDDEILLRIQQTADGGYILGGHSDSGISGDKTQTKVGSMDYWLVKIDANGNKLWDKTYGGNSDDLLYGLQITNDGGYLLAGMSNSGISGDKSQPNKGYSYGNDIWIVKVDANGNKQWDKSFGGSGSDDLLNLIKTSDGGYMLVADTGPDANSDLSQPSKGMTDIWVIKLDANGIKQWDKTIGGSNMDQWGYVEQTSDGGYILGGSSDSGISGDKSQASRGDYDNWVIKLDATGNKQWDKTFGGSGHDELYEIHQTMEGGYILGGVSQSGLSGDKSQPSNGGIDFWIVKLDANGNKIWDKSLGGAQNDQLFELQQTSDGGYLLSGDSDSGISGNKTLASKGMLDFWLVKIAADVLGTSEALTSDISLYPNPTSGIINIELKDKRNAQIEIYNALGQRVYSKSNDSQNDNLLIDLTHEAKGIYTIRIISENHTIVRKIAVE